MKGLITICARGGSKGIPGKNIKLLNSIPLIAYSIKVAQEFASKFGARIALSTDDDAILDVARQYGVDSNYIRPASLATDNAGKISAISDLLLYEEKKNNIRFDYILDLDVTSPLRTCEDLELAYEALLSDESALNLFSVNDAARNPYFNMVELKKSGYYNLVKNDGVVLSRQTAPQVYDLNASFYFYRRQFFNDNYQSVFTDRSLIYKMPHLCFDLDHVVDFEFLNFLISENKLDFDIWK